MRTTEGNYQFRMQLTHLLNDEKTIISRRYEALQPYSSVFPKDKGRNSKKIFQNLKLKSQYCFLNGVFPSLIPNLKIKNKNKKNST